MSLDLTLCCQHCGHHVGEFNYTYNVANVWIEAMPEDMRMIEIEGMTGKESQEKIERAIAVLKADPDRFKKMDPENKWGSYDTFVIWLEELLVRAKEYPTAKWSAWR